MRSSTKLLILIFILSFVGMITISLFGAKKVLDDVDFSNIEATVLNLSHEIQDEVDYSSKTSIDQNITNININLPEKVELSLVGTENSRVYVEEYHLYSDINVEDDTLNISTDNQSVVSHKSKLKLYIPKNQIDKITIKANENVEITNIDVNEIECNIIDGDVILNNSEIETLSGDIFDGGLINNNTNITNNELTDTQG